MIPIYKAHIPDAAIGPLREVFGSGQIADGVWVRDFEHALRTFLGNRYLTTVGDVSSGIQLALMLSGLKPGDEVLASPMACVATNQPILLAGGRIRWCDVEPLTGMVSPRTVAQAWTPETRALVHPLWAGDVPDLDGLNALARERGFSVVEDAGEALGAEYRGRKVGATDTDFTVFSFHAIRHITTGEGGAIAFREAGFADRAQWRKRYAIHRPSFRNSLGEIDPACDIQETGLNTYLTNIAGAIGVAQMDRIEGVLASHRRHAVRLGELLSSIPGISLCDRPAVSRSAYWVYTVLAERSEDLLRALRSRGVHASRVHLRNDRYSCFGGASGRDFPGLESFAARYLCLPCGWWMTDEDVEHVGATVKQGW